MRYRWDLLPAITGKLSQGRGEAALADFDELIAQLTLTSPSGLGVFKLRCAQCMSVWARGARAAGADSEPLLDEHVRALERLASLTTKAAVCRFLKRYLEALSRTVGTVTLAPGSRMVRDIQSDIAASLARPRTLLHYAQAFGVSVGHLSRTYRHIAGETFSATQARLRHAAVLAALERGGASVGAIARSLGVRSASQLIAAFKAREGVTPGAWRRRRR